MGMKLHVGNLQSSITEDDLVITFGRFGAVASVIVFRDADTGISRGFGSVEMATDEAATNAISSLNLTQQDGLTMIVGRARAG